MSGWPETSKTELVREDQNVVSQLQVLHEAVKQTRDFRITAIIPVYNRFKWVPRAIDSILAQTYPPDEIILVDDGSKTPLADFLAPLGYLDRVRVCRSDENLGSSEARNYGARQAKTEWVAFLDSDDLWFPDCLERLTDHLRNTPDCDGVDGPMVYKFPDREVVFGRDRAQRMRLIDAVTQNQIYNQLFLVKRKLISELGYDSRVYFFDDYALSLRLASGGYNVDHIYGEAIGVHHRLGENFSGDRFRMLRAAFKVLWLYRQQYREAFGPGAMVYQSGRILFLIGRKVRKVGIALRFTGRVLMSCVPWAPRVGPI